jgi:hypothetical protein
VGFQPYVKYFYGLLANFWRFDPFLEDLGPFFRLDLGGEVGKWLPTSGLYKLEALESMGEGSK